MLGHELLQVFFLYPPSFLSLVYGVGASCLPIPVHAGRVVDVIAPVVQVAQLVGLGYHLAIEGYIAFHLVAVFPSSGKCVMLLSNPDK